MKIKNTLLAGAFSITTCLYAQKEPKFLPTEITMEDGSTLTGYIENFKYTNQSVFGDPLVDFKSFESKLKLDRKKFKFKKEQEDKVTELNSELMKKITLFENDTVTYEKLYLKTINSKNELVDLKKQVFIPLIKKGKIDLYGFTVTTQTGPFNDINVLSYIKKPEDNFAVIPIDMSRLNLFNAWSMDERFIAGFAEITKDCESYQVYLKEMLEKSKSGDKEYRKAQKENFEKFMKNTPELQNPEDKLFSYFNSMYITFIDKYTSMCN